MTETTTVASFNEKKGEQSADDRMRSVTQILGILPKIAGGVVGITAIAYVLGLSASKAYFDGLGASWVIQLMSASQITLLWSYLLIIMCIFAFAGVIAHLSGVQPRAIGFGAVVFAVLSLVLYGVGNYLEGHGSPSSAHKILFFGSVVWAATAGLSVGEAAGYLALANPPHMKILSAAQSLVWIGLFFVPQSIGSTAAARDGAIQESKLPIVQVQGSEQGWKLVCAVGDRLLLMKFAEGKEGRKFRLIKPEDATVSITEK